MKALLLSGGMDSFSLAYAMRPDIAMTIDYGQKPATAEINSSTILCKSLGIHHEIISTDISKLGSGDLSDRPAISIAPASDWWPYRNQMLITIAAMHLIGKGVNEIAIATVKSDSIHVDGQSTFINSIDKLMRLQEGSISITAPAIEKSTQQLVRDSKIPYPLLAWSHSCHTSNIACGICRGCIKHREVVEDLGYAKI